LIQVNYFRTRVAALAPFPSCAAADPVRWTATVAAGKEL